VKLSIFAQAVVILFVVLLAKLLAWPPVVSLHCDTNKKRNRRGQSAPAGSIEASSQHEKIKRYLFSFFVQLQQMLKILCNKSETIVQLKR
jgi:hypothetical protein